MTEILDKEKTEETETRPGKVTYQDLKRSANGPVAKFFSDGTLKALPPDDNPDGKPRMRFVVSTTTVDLVGDVMSEAAIDKMLAQAIGKTFFVNHSYVIPQDVLGKVESGRKFTQKTTDPVTGETGNYLFLEFVILVAMSNPVAVKTYELVKEDEIKLGASVSIIILEGSKGSKGTRVIDDLYYLECSAVGIPANQASWSDSISKAFKEWERTNKNKTSEVEIEMSKPEETQKPETVKKNVFDDVMAMDAEMGCYDLAYALCNQISLLLIRADGGGEPDAESIARTLVSDFSEAVLGIVLPALGALGEQTEAQEVVEMSAKVKNYFTWKIPALATDKAAPAPTVTSKDKKDADPYQEMHDYCISKGASCKDMDGDTDGDNDNTTSEEKSVNAEQAQVLNKALEIKAALEQENTGLKTELANAKNESKRWEATSVLLKEKLQDYLKQPASL